MPSRARPGLQERLVTWTNWSQGLQDLPELMAHKA